MSFRRRLIVFSAAAVAVSIALASVVTYVVVRGQMRGQVDNSLREQAAGAVAIRVTAPVPAAGGAKRDVLEGAVDPGAIVALPQEPLGSTPVYGQIVKPDGEVVQSDPPGDQALAARPKLPVDRRTRDVAKGLREPFFEDRNIDGQHVRVYTARTAKGAVVQVARLLGEVDASLRTLAILLGLVNLGGVALAAGLGFLVSRAALRPVAQLTDAAEHVAQTRDLSRRIDAHSPDELGRLAASFNTMLEALDASLGAQRQLVADASHELRTPLTSLRTNVELLARARDMPLGDRERLLHDLTSQLEELTVLVGDLVDLARGDEPEHAVEDVRLDVAVADAVDRARRHAPNRLFETDLEPCLVRGVPARIDRAVANLLDNAAKWSPAGGRIDVCLTADGNLTVRDHGPGIDDEDLPHVFDRFYRAPAARGTPGSGLGLAIVRQVAESHGGRVAVESLRENGGGTRFQLSLQTS
jgi:two-component system, OmpR family, sensor histidine kinase MprB